MRATRCVLISTLIAALVGGAAFAQSPDTDASAVTPGLGGGAAIVVNGEVVTSFDVQQRALLIAMMSGMQINQQTRGQLIQQAMRSLVDEHLELQELRRLEKDQKFQIVATDDEVNEAIADLAKGNNLSPEDFRARLSGAGLKIDTLREQLRVQTSWQRMISGRYAARTKISESQVEREIQRATAAAAEPQYQVSEIYLEASRVGGMTEALEGAQQLLAQMQQQSAPFAAVARQFSAASTAASGGDVGWVSASDLPPEVAQFVSQMTPGQVSTPIQTTDGVYIIQLRNKRNGGTTTMVTMKQAAVAVAADATPDKVAEATAKLMTLISSGPSCDNLIAKAAADSEIIANDLGESDVNSLSPEIREAVTPLQVGQISQPVRSPVGMHAFILCGKRNASADSPTRQAVERRILSDQLTMLSRRYVRDLRSTATIEQPQS